MIKRGRRPSGGRMALRAAVGELGRCMLRSRLIGRGVTAVAIGRRVRVLPVHMTLHAGHGCVSSGQREPGQVVIVSRRTPARRGVTLRARVIKITRLMRRVLRVVIIYLMTAIAIGRSPVEHAVHMALRTSRGQMLTGQRKVCGAVIEGRRRPT